MVNETLDKVVGTFQFNCTGIDVFTGSRANRIVNRAFTKEQAESVIVKVYQSGKSTPLCKYFHDEICIASVDNQNHGNCPYYSVR